MCSVMNAVACRNDAGFLDNRCFLPSLPDNFPYVSGPICAVDFRSNE